MSVLLDLEFTDFTVLRLECSEVLDCDVDGLALVTDDVVANDEPEMDSLILFFSTSSAEMKSSSCLLLAGNLLERLRVPPRSSFSDQSSIQPQDMTRPFTEMGRSTNAKHTKRQALRFNNVADKRVASP